MPPVFYILLPLVCMVVVGGAIAVAVPEMQMSRCDPKLIETAERAADSAVRHWQRANKKAAIDEIVVAVRFANRACDGLRFVNGRKIIERKIRSFDGAASLLAEYDALPTNMQ